MKLANRKECTGCSACYAGCPSGAIQMGADQDGFYIPVIDFKLCTNCGLCEKICPILNTDAFGDQDKEPLICYGAKTKDIGSLMRSSSGGVFYEIARCVIESGGCVFGCRLDKKLRAVHVVAETLIDLDAMRGSKYVQSDLKDSFRKCKKMLERERLVLFVGTPCQIIGLRSYLRKRYAGLIAVDFICHGVPAPEVFEQYKKEAERKAGSQLKSLSFRDKFYSWKTFCMRLCFENSLAHTVESLNQNVYFKAFLGNYCLRESCYDCQCKSVKGCADLTISDFWGVEKFYPEFFDERGVSSIIIHSEVGNDIVNKIKDRLELLKVDLSEIEAENPSYRMPVRRPARRDTFMLKYGKHGILSALRGPLVSWLIRGIIYRLSKVVK